MLKIKDKSYKRLPGVYIITNLINGKEYIGESEDIKRRMWTHSTSKTQVIHKAIIKYGIDNFQVYCEYFPNSTKLFRLGMETDMIDLYETLAPRGYNICRIGCDCIGYKHTESALIKMSETHKGKSFSDDHKRKLSLSHKGKILSETTKLKIGESSKGRTHSEKTKIKMSKSKLGVKFGESHCNNISKGKMGKPLSESHKKNLSIAFTGRTQSETTREKISLSNKGKVMSEESKLKNRINKPNIRSVIQFTIDGTELFNYYSIAEASRRTGVGVQNISACCRGVLLKTGGYKWSYGS